jgi:hypothetical protein
MTEHDAFDYRPYFVDEMGDFAGWMTDQDIEAMYAQMADAAEQRFAAEGVPEWVTDPVDQADDGVAF